MTAGRSPLATQVRDLVADRRRTGSPWGLCVHTSGSGVVGRAEREGRHPDEVALDYYDSARYSAHYLAGWRGYYQITDDGERVQHVGFADPATGAHGIGGRMSARVRRQWYLGGQWRRDMPASFVQAWDRAWPGRASPAHLYPSTYPNDDYVAIECIPLAVGEGWQGGRFSLSQHIVVAVCGAELAGRHGWPDGWERTSRLVGHDDVGPHSRVKRGESWDPGRHRERPWIHWPTVQAWVGICREGGVEWPLELAAQLGDWPR